MVNINKDYMLTPAEYKKMSYGLGNSKEYLCIHTTDNWKAGARALNHALLQKNGNYRNASWHYTVDDRGAYQSLPDGVKAWHAGSGNTKSIAIEACVNSDGNWDKTMRNLVELSAKVMKANNIPLSKLVQHNFFTGKNCPREIRAGKGGWTWDKFKREVSNALAGKVETASKPSKPNKPVRGFLVTKDDLNLYDTPRWKNPSKEVKKGTQLTIVGSAIKDKVKMYETDEGYYITSVDKYITYYTKAQWKKHCAKKKSIGKLTTKVALNYYDSPRWVKPSGETKKGSTHNIVDIVKADGVNMYETDSGNYMTTSDKYVEFKKC